MSPPSLTALGPYGKAPLLVTGARDGSRHVPESAAIATYLIRTFDAADRFGLRGGDWVRDEMLLSIAQTDLGKATTNMLMLDFGMIRNGTGPGGKRYDGPAIRAVLKHLERELEDGPEGGYFMGERPGRADVMLEFPMAMTRQRGYVDLAAEFPALERWLERCYRREAWKKGLEKGNGYDLMSFPRLPRE
jgi:glutathione S-transferase